MPIEIWPEMEIVCNAESGIIWLLWWDSLKFYIENIAKQKTCSNETLHYCFSTLAGSEKSSIITTYISVTVQEIATPCIRQEHENALWNWYGPGAY